MGRLLALTASGVLLVGALLAVGWLAVGAERVAAQPLPLAEEFAAPTGGPAGVALPTPDDGPAVRYGDSGLLEEPDRGMPLWQLVLLSLAAAGGLTGAYLSYRRLR